MSGNGQINKKAKTPLGGHWSPQMQADQPMMYKAVQDARAHHDKLRRQLRYSSVDKVAIQQNIDNVEKQLMVKLREMATDTHTGASSSQSDRPRQQKQLQPNDTPDDRPVTQGQLKRLMQELMPQRCLALANEAAENRELKKMRKSLDSAKETLAKEPPESWKREIILQYLQGERQVPDSWENVLRTMKREWPVQQAAAQILMDDVEEGRDTYDGLYDNLAPSPVLLETIAERIAKHYIDSAYVLPMPEALENRVAQIIAAQHSASASENEGDIENSEHERGSDDHESDGENESASSQDEDA